MYPKTSVSTCKMAERSHAEESRRYGGPQVLAGKGRQRQRRRRRRRNRTKEKKAGYLFLFAKCPVTKGDIFWSISNYPPQHSANNKTGIDKGMENSDNKQVTTWRKQQSKGKNSKHMSSCHDDMAIIILIILIVINLIVIIIVAIIIITIMITKLSLF